MSKTEIMKRYILFIISLFFTAIGVALTKHAALGVSPLSSVANVLSIKYTSFSMGNFLILWNCALILGQIVILRKNFQRIQLLQLPLSFLFGYFTDFGMQAVSFILVENYATRILLILAGVLVLGFGISLAVIADVILNSGEALVKAIADTTGFVFGNVKTAFDMVCVVLSILLSLLFFDFSIVGTREGTILSALLTGMVVKFFTRYLKKPLESLFCDKQHIWAAE